MHHGEAAPSQRPGPPPIKPWVPLAWLVPTGIALALLVLGGVPGPGPLDHADKAEQRTGILIPASEAVNVTELDLPGDPVGDDRTLVVFDRAAPDPDRFREWGQALPRGTETVIVLPASAAAHLPAKVVTHDPERMAAALRMDTPQDGGFPIGYAIVDSAGLLRYQTLDPGYLAHPSEVATMVGAVQ